jgi:ribonuclease HII
LVIERAERDAAERCVDTEVLHRRDELAAEIRVKAIAWAVGQADVLEIDRINILQATMLAMRRAVDGLSIAPGEAWIDGDRCPQLRCAMRAIVKGDRDVAVISAASIIAKTARDAMLVELDGRYPLYGFAHNRGYGTPEHLAALQKHGPCPAHRKSFAPVAQTSFDF